MSRDSVASLARSSAWLLSSRLIAMGVGLVGLPVLMSALGADQFGAWAVLLGGTFAFGTLELGMSSAAMRWTTLALMPDAAPERRDLSVILSTSLLCTLLLFALGAVPLLLWADDLAHWLRLPQTPLLTAGQCIEVVYLTVALLALLRCTIAPLLAARRTGTHAAFTLLQSLIGAATTWTVAWTTRRLDLVLIANAIAIVVVQLVGAVWTRRHLPWRFELARVDARLGRAMLGYGSALQFSDLSSFVMYQFDKLIIAGVVMPAEVAHYEVASRSAQALGNVSTAPFAAFAPGLTERHGRAEDPREEVLRLMRLTVLGVGLFLLLPLTVAPIGLFAWVGQIGYHAAGVFVLLALAVIGTALTLPLSLYAQASGRPGLELMRAALAMLVNVPLSLGLIHHYGKEGAALGTLIASLSANALFAVRVLWLLQLRAGELRRALWPLAGPLIGVAVLVALTARWIEPVVIVSRWYMAPAAALLYAAGLTLALAWLWLGARFNAEERHWLTSLPRQLRRKND